MAATAAAASPATTTRPKTRPLSIAPPHSLPLPTLSAPLPALHPQARRTPPPAPCHRHCRRRRRTSSDNLPWAVLRGQGQRRHGSDHPRRAPHPSLLPPRRVPKARIFRLRRPRSRRLPQPLRRRRRRQDQVLRRHRRRQLRLRLVPRARPRRARRRRRLAVVAESYARIFFRNSVATGEMYPLESEGRLCEECATGDVVTVEVEECRLVNHTTGKVYKLKPIGDAGPVIDAGGIFAYARKTGMISYTNAA